MCYMLYMNAAFVSCCSLFENLFEFQNFQMISQQVSEVNLDRYTKKEKAVIFF